MKINMSIINKLLKSSKNSIYGLITAFKTDKTIKLEFILTLPIIILAIFFFKLNEAFLIIFLWFLVIIVELINTSIEKTIDFISLERNIEIKNIKDISSSAVFLSLCLFVLAIFLIIFFKLSSYFY
tara:strand:+ start:1612 stop:1989 length:378 start_codon:yes stop_codon:yes gene_type:complete